MTEFPPETIEEILVRSANLPPQGLFWHALNTGSVELLKESIKKGANPNEVDSMGKTPLVYLLERARNALHQSGDRQTVMDTLPLHVALLKSGADAGLKSSLGYPLSRLMLCFYDVPKFIDELLPLYLNHGARAKVKEEGYSLLSFAVNAGFKEASSPPKALRFQTNEKERYAVCNFNTSALNNQKSDFKLLIWNVNHVGTLIGAGAPLNFKIFAKSFTKKQEIKLDFSDYFLDESLDTPFLKAFILMSSGVRDISTVSIIFDVRSHRQQLLEMFLSHRDIQSLQTLLDWNILSSEEIELSLVNFREKNNLLTSEHIKEDVRVQPIEDLIERARLNQALPLSNHPNHSHPRL